jgi:hypothetical protein
MSKENNKDNYVNGELNEKKTNQEDEKKENEIERKINSEEFDKKEINEIARVKSKSTLRRLFEKKPSQYKELFLSPAVSFDLLKINRFYIL